jgi:ankyrin repeat protein
MHPLIKKLIILYILLLGIHLSSFAQIEEESSSNDSSYVITDPNYELLIAAGEGDIAKITLLLQLGADVNHSNYDGVTPLMYASQAGHLRAVEMLIDEGANVNAVPYNQVSALLGACIAGHVEVADTLILNGAFVDTKNYNGVTPLMYASAFGNDVLVDMLLFYKAKVNKQDRDGNTALIYSVFYDNPPTTELLVNAGADINLTDTKGFSPLLIAAQNGYYEHVAYLLNNGADINHTNSNGLSAISLAIINNHPDVLELLIENGGDINHKISESRNEMALASEYGNNEIRNLLINNGVVFNKKIRIDKLIFGFDMNWNANDFMIGGNITLIESKYGVLLKGGFLTRPTPRSVLYKKESNYYYQFWESRSIFNLGLQKRFIIKKFSIHNNMGFVAGFSGAYTYGNFRGSDKKAEVKILLNPNASFFLNLYSGYLSLGYDYLKLPDLKLSPHRFNLTIGFTINTTKNKIKLKAEPEL